MTHTPTRRSITKGAAWSIPAVAVASAAPAVAASPCSEIKKGQPLPASAFAPGYLIVTNQTFGGVADKAISIAAGIALTSAATTCVGSAALTFSFAKAGTLALSNGKSYTVSGGTGASGSGTTGQTSGGCSGPAGSTGQACVTYISIDVANSTGTSSANPASAALTFTANVAGYGTTTVTLNAAGFVKDGTNWDGTGVTVI